MTGAMNTAGQIGASVMSVAFGYLVETYGYNAPLAGLAGLFILSALLWLRIDPTKPIFEPSEAAT